MEGLAKSGVNVATRHTHLFRFHTGTFQCLTSCLRRHSDAVFSPAAVTARMDTRTAEYPFIAGIHPLGKHFIGDHLCAEHNSPWTGSPVRS